MASSTTNRLVTMMETSSLRTDLDDDAATTPTTTLSSQVVVVVDPTSTGRLVAREIWKRGYTVLALFTKAASTVDGSNKGGSLPPTTAAATTKKVGQYHAAELYVGANSSIVETAAQCERAASAVQQQPATIVACLSGGETGVDLAEALAVHWKFRINDSSSSSSSSLPSSRLNKQNQQELVRSAGLRAVRQAGGSQWSDVQDFLSNKEAYPVVLKPLALAGSDGEKLCNDIAEAQDHFNVLMQSQMVHDVGSSAAAVVCQEFLRGTEYVVDSVSRDGIHKTVMVWVYDKRPTNGSSYVYFGCIPVDATSPEGQVLIPYVRGVLDALVIRDGPSHGNVMMTDQGPCLVEMNCRAHGGDGHWRPLCRTLTGGYSQVEVTVDAALDEASFLGIPDVPVSPFKASGQKLMLVSFSRGTVKSSPGYEVVKNLPSFVSLETSISPGATVDYTVDLYTGIGSVVLMHSDAAVLQRDIEFIRYMEQINGFFVYETKLENLKRPTGEQVVLQAVLENSKNKGDLQNQQHRRVFSSDSPMLIRHMSNDRPELRGPLVKRMTTVDASKEAAILVDPYSTGCCIAEEIQKRGYSVIALWTKGFSPEMKTHIPLSVGNIKYTAEVDQADTLADTVSAIYKAAGKLRVVACMAGGEAGVDFADALSEHMKLRTNGTRIPNKRDKKLQQELAAAAGLRSVRQACSDKFSDVEEFLTTEDYPVVLKPVESAGSDGVKLCHNFEEAKEHFDVLMNSQMVNGGDCPSVLCQEFLRGKEYVVDHVSRDGKHKTVMVWVYDKRQANGSAFVYFGCVPIDSNSPEAKILIPYVRRVLDSLDIKNGPSHGEVMMTNDGPCLVEMNCRAHGGDGNWRSLCRALNGGYSQVETAVDSFLDSRQFMITPEKCPSPFKASGQEVILVSFSRGVVKATPGFSEIKNLESFVYLETGVKPGSMVDYTVDLFTGIGSVILVHDDEEVLNRDVKRIRQMESENLFFEYEQASYLFKSASTVNLDAAVISTSDRPDMY